MENIGENTNTEKPAVKVVKIRQQGNLIEVSPDCEEILGEPLSFLRRKFLYAGPHNDSIVSIVKEETYSVSDGKLFVQLGALDRVVRELELYGYKVEIQSLDQPNERLVADMANIFKWMPGVEFRTGQKEILSIMDTCNRAQFVAPTGFGKSYLIRMMCAMYPKAKIIICVPSLSLVMSTYEKLAKLTPDVGRVCTGHKDNKKRIIVCTSASLLAADPTDCDILLFDECHTAAADRISQNISMISCYKKFGFTATPTGRSDGAELKTEVMFGPVRYKVNYNDAVDAGIVSKLRVIMIEVEDCGIRSNMYSRPVAKKRHMYWRNECRNRAIAEAVESVPRIYGLPEDAQRLILVETLEHAYRLARCLPGYQVVYAGVTEEKFAMWKRQGLIPEHEVPLTAKKREELLIGFESGAIRKAIATSTWGTGVDFVNLDILVYAGGSPSEIRATQWPGRNSRKYHGKQLGIIIDCNDTWDRWSKCRTRGRLAVYNKHRWDIEYAQNTKVYSRG